MKLGQLFLSLVLFMSADISFAQFPRSQNDPLLREEEEALKQPIVKITCVNLDTAKRITTTARDCNVNPNFVLETDYTIIKAQDLKSVCPNKVNLESDPVDNSSTAKMYPDLMNRPTNLRNRNIVLLEEEPERISLKAPCYFQTQEGRKIEVKNYYRKCHVKGLKEKSLNVTSMWRGYNMNFEKLSECYNSKVNEMQWNDIFTPRITPKPAAEAAPGTTR